MPENIPRSMLSALLDGQADPASLSRYDALDLASTEAPDLRWASLERLRPILDAFPSLRHLEMAENARDFLEDVLAGLTPGCLRSVRFVSTEAYTSSTDAETFRLLAESPAARELREISVIYSNVEALAVLCGSPLRQLERLELIGYAPAQELAALAGPAPALRSLRSLSLSPDELTPEIAAGIAANPDLAGLAELELPLISGGGFDWGADYRGQRFARAFDGSLEALGRLPGLRTLRVSCPYDIDQVEISGDLMRALARRARSAEHLELDSRLAHAVDDPFFELDEE